MRGCGSNDRLIHRRRLSGKRRWIFDPSILGTLADASRTRIPPVWWF